MTDTSASETKGQIPTNLRLLLILEEVARAEMPVAAATLSETLGLPKPTIHRLLATAEEEGFLQRDIDGRSYGPGRRLRKLAGNTLSSQRLRTERLIIMQALASEVGETCNLAAPGRYGMVYLDRVETHWPLRIQLPVGAKVPFHCTASGKLYLSSLRNDKLKHVLSWLQLDPSTEKSITDVDSLLEELASTRARGFSTDNEEFMDGMVAIAVPVRDTESRLLTTLSIHAPRQRYDLDRLIGMVPLVQETAKRLEALGRL